MRHLGKAREERGDFRHERFEQFSDARCSSFFRHRLFAAFRLAPAVEVNLINYLWPLLITTKQKYYTLLIGINRPAKRNGFTPKMFRELGEAYTRLDDEPDLRAGVLHAFGDHFTAGLDLPTIAPLMQRGEKAVPLGLVDPLNLGMEGYRRRTKPMVVAVKGITYTLGIELMLAADIVVAAVGRRDTVRADMLQAVTLVNQAIEAIVLSQPGQYLWGYARYKTPRKESA